MRYLCLVYPEQAKLDALTKLEYAGILGEIQEYDAELSKSGYAIPSSLLHATTLITTIQVRHGQIAITHAPCAEAAEPLAGFYLIEARDLNDAIRVAARMPFARLGRIEIYSLVEHGLP